MRIRQLEIEGFRSLKNVTWELGDLNILIGLNNTGKSNLLRLLELMAVAAQGGLDKYIQSLGGMGAIVWDSQARDIRYLLKSSRDNYLSGTYKFDYELHLSRLGQGSGYIVSKELLTHFSDVPGDETREPINLIQRNQSIATLYGGQSKTRRVIRPENFAETETLLSATTSAFVPIRELVIFKKYLSSIAVYHDVEVSQKASIRQSAVSRVESRVDYDGQNLISVLHTLYTSNRDFERSIDEAMGTAFGSDYEKLIFPPAADQRIQLRVRWKTLRHEQSAANLSDGMLRFLFLLTVLANPDPPSVIAIDEPETWLHPAMLPIIAEYAVDATLRAQVILTTHSPQLLDAFTDKNPTTTVTKWQDGETVLKNLSGDDLAYWLREYTLGTLFKSGELESMA